MMKEIPELDAAGLRKFALTTSAIVVVLFGGFFPWVLNLNWPLWPWILAAVLSLWGLAWPAGLNPVYTLWMKFGLVMGAISSRIILSVIYFILFTPMALVMKIMGKDPMQRSLQSDASSYRKPRQAYNPKSMEKPF